MRKVVLGVGISLDGYIARPDGAVDFLFMPKDYSMAPFFKRIDTAVMGRKSYEMGLKLGGGKLYNYGMKCYVFSRTLDSVAHKDFAIVNEPLKPFVEALRKKKGKDIWLMGGGELTRAFLQDDLVDALYLGVVPVLIGEGIPAFPSGFPEQKFALIENKTYSKGMIALRYERRVKKQKEKDNAEACLRQAGAEFAEGRRRKKSGGVPSHRKKRPPLHEQKVRKNISGGA